MGIPESMHQALLKHAGKMITFVSNLTSERMLPDGTVVKPAMPLSAFLGARALVFLFRRKIGLLGSYEWEFGFITQKIVGLDGSISWSPPYFIHGRTFGLGLTVGHFTIGLCIALLDEAAVHHALSPRTFVTAKGLFLVDMDGARVRGTKFDSTSQEDNVTYSKAGTSASYYRADAMLIELSLNLGYIKPAKCWNNTAYGSATAEDVLAGKVLGPRAFGAALDLLKKKTELAAMSTRPGYGRTRSNPVIRESSVVDGRGLARSAHGSDRSVGFDAGGKPSFQ